MPECPETALELILSHSEAKPEYNSGKASKPLKTQGNAFSGQNDYYHCKRKYVAFKTDKLTTVILHEEVPDL